jgi:hypothetical protein
LPEKLPLTHIIRQAERQQQAERQVNFLTLQWRALSQHGKRGSLVLGTWTPMIYMRLRFCLWAAIIPVLASAGAVAAATYYVSNDGDDSNSGLDPSAPWRTVAKVNNSTFAPGSTILFDRGSEWREALTVPSSGTASQPIIFDAYGTGAKPRFWGSDVLDKSQFQLIPGSASAYSMPVSTSYSVLLDHQFVHSADLMSGSSDPATNISWVKSNPNTWYFTGGQLYLNTGGVSPASDPRVYTSVTRENLIHADHQNHIVFRNLITDESARWGGGCGFRVFFSDDVRIESSEAYRAGKHHFCVTDANGFVGKNLYASTAMPDLGYGGASPFVSYSDPHRSGDTSSWIDDVSENPNGPYPGFITHGEGMGDVLIRNMQVRGGPGLTIYTEGSNQKIRVEGGSVDGEVLLGSNVTVDGLRINGPYGLIDISGNNNVVQNTLLVGRQTNWQSGMRAAITDSGQNNTIRFNTIVLAPNGNGGAIGINKSTSNTQIYGNVFADPQAIAFYDGSPTIDSHDNFFAADPQFGIFSGVMTYRTLAQWKAMGLDVSSLAAAVGFQNPANGDYALAGASGGIDYFDDPVLFPDTDLRGFPRTIGTGADMGAFERPILGDANFDGVIDELDFALIDHAYRTQMQEAGYANGDFDFSGGPPNADDYFIIDQALIAQWLRQNPGLAAGEGTSVPEPGALWVVVMSACLFVRWRRNDREPGRQF